MCLWKPFPIYHNTILFVIYMDAIKHNCNCQQIGCLFELDKFRALNLQTKDYVFGMHITLINRLG